MKNPSNFRWIRVFLVVFCLQWDKRCKQQYHHKQRRRYDKAQSAEEERQPCKPFHSICARHRKHYADKRQRQTCDIQPLHQVNRKYAVEEIECGEEKHERCVQCGNKPYASHDETQNQHGFARCHIRIRLRLSLHGLFCHNKSI